MQDFEFGSRSDSSNRGERAQDVLARMFAEAGWRVHQEPKHPRGRPDLLVDRQDSSAAYVIELKAAAEGRSDRLVPLWSQAYLQAARYAGDKYAPLAVVAAPRIAPRVADHILEFAKIHAPEAAAGVIDFAGLRRFRGSYLEGLDSEAPYLPFMKSPPVESADLFSDLNQWMLKVLLAPELPPNLLAAPRRRYYHVSELARAARVSRVSAHRFVQQLRREGYLHESAPYFALVRREDLFKNWQLAASRRIKELSMRFLLRSDPQHELERFLKRARGCLALFAAAEALKVGFVHGVPPYAYVERLDPASISAWRNVAPVEPHESPDFILRRPSAPKSVFRGMVRIDAVPVSDILQVWLDVSSHPSRGQEQADLIRHRILEQLISERHPSG